MGSSSFGYIDVPPPQMNNYSPYGGYPNYPPMQPQPMQPMQPSYPAPMMAPPMGGYQSMPIYQSSPHLGAAAAPVAGVRPSYSPYGYQNTLYSFQFRGRKLDRKDIFSPSDPFLTLSAPSGTVTQAKKMKKQYDSAKKKKKYRDPSRKGKWTVVYKVSASSSSSHLDRFLVLLLWISFVLRALLSYSRK